MFFIWWLRRLGAMPGTRPEEYGTIRSAKNLRPNAAFKDAKAATLLSVGNIFGIGSAEQNAVKSAWQSIVDAQEGAHTVKYSEEAAPKSLQQFTQGILEFARKRSKR
jgi:hypothetical protein